MPRDDLVRLRRGTTEQWEMANTILDEGEPGVDTDLGVIKVGDGFTHWLDLPDSGGPGGGGSDSRLDAVLAANHVSVPGGDSQVSLLPDPDNEAAQSVGAAVAYLLGMAQEGGGGGLARLQQVFDDNRIQEDCMITGLEFPPGVDATDTYNKKRNFGQAIKDINGVIAGLTTDMIQPLQGRVSAIESTAILGFVSKPVVADISNNTGPGIVQQGVTAGLPDGFVGAGVMLSLSVSIGDDTTGLPDLPVAIYQQTLTEADTGRVFVRTVSVRVVGPDTGDGVQYDISPGAWFLQGGGADIVYPAPAAGYEWRWAVPDGSASPALEGRALGSDDAWVAQTYPATALTPETLETRLDRLYTDVEGAGFRLAYVEDSGGRSLVVQANVKTGGWETVKTLVALDGNGDVTG